MSGKSQFYPNARHLFATGALSWTVGNYKCLIMASGYSPNFATDTYLSDVPAPAIIATSPTITGIGESLGYLTGDTIPFGVISSALIAGSLIFFKDTGVPSSSPLIVYVDTPDVAGFPQALTGFNYYVYKNLVGGWFRL